MNIHQKTILSDAEIFVKDIFYKQINDRFTFHNIDHTCNVVKAANKMAAFYPLTNEDEFSLKLAAWFHDTGFRTGIIENHETESILIAKDFLENKIETNVLEQVLSCIRATEIPQRPSGLVEKIMCDADLYHLGTDKFLEFSKHLKKEREQYFKIKISDEEWRQRDIEFLKSHTYFTRYCQQHLELVKQQWLQKLQND